MLTMNIPRCLISMDTRTRLVVKARSTPNVRTAADTIVIPCRASRSDILTEWEDFLEFITAMRLMGFGATLAYNSHFRRQEILRLVHTAAKFLQQETQAIHHTKLRGHYAPVTAAAHRLSLFQTLPPTESPRLPTVGKTKLTIFFFSFKPLQPAHTQRHKHHHGPPSQTLTLKNKPVAHLKI